MEDDGLETGVLTEEAMKNLVDKVRYLNANKVGHREMETPFYLEENSRE